ncbi:hypothetical protein CLOM621_08571 [Clostridium sp. M62/1]|nr:hypothetical protein CLOM621_08571 [Clostridium sp. M62/1]
MYFFCTGTIIDSPDENMYWGAFLQKKAVSQSGKRWNSRKNTTI